MKLLVTGSQGFLGKNLIATLNALNHEVLSFDRENTLEDLKRYTANCDFVIHLAGINRPKDPSEFYRGNAGLTETLCELLQDADNKAPVLISSSIQASLDNDYGRSKREGEEILISHHQRNQSPIHIFRFSNLFGKWSRPNYNSVVATWCHNISHGIDISINDRNTRIVLEYIDDVVEAIVDVIHGCAQTSKSHYCTVPLSYDVTLGEIADLLYKFKASRETLYLPNLAAGFEKKLYSTYLSYLPKNAFVYPLVSHTDARGSFTEFLKSDERGQVSINISKPNITKGQHWHHSKNEKFMVVSGEGLIQLRDIYESEIIDIHVSGEKLEVVDIPTGYTHNIINTGKTDMVTVMWVNEPFDPEHPDTYPMEV